MKTKDIKTIDINAKEWFDRTYGNSYFSGSISVNYGLDNELNFTMPFQYGYGEHYVDMAKKELEKEGIITDLKHYDNGSSEALWNYCRNNKIILRTHKQTNCKKRELQY